MHDQRKTRFAGFLTLLGVVIATIVVLVVGRYATEELLKVLALIGCVVFITSRAH